MYVIKKVMTDDGTCFDTYTEARKYLDKKYGDQLTRIAHKILAHSKYFSLCEFLNENLGMFQELIDLKNELSVGIINEDEE